MVTHFWYPIPLLTAPRPFVNAQTPSQQCIKSRANNISGVKLPFPAACLRALSSNVNVKPSHDWIPNPTTCRRHARSGNIVNTSCPAILTVDCCEKQAPVFMFFVPAVWLCLSQTRPVGVPRGLMFGGTQLGIEHSQLHTVSGAASVPLGDTDEGSGSVSAGQILFGTTNASASDLPDGRPGCPLVWSSGLS